MYPILHTNRDGWFIFSPADFLHTILGDHNLYTRHTADQVLKGDSTFENPD